MSIEASFHAPGKNLEWLVNQFLVIRFDGKTELLEKFIPRSDISLVFHFNAPPAMLKPEQVTLPYFFIAPVITQASLLRINKKNVSFIITCKPTVFSRAFNLSLISGTHPYLLLPDKIFRPLWQKLCKIRDSAQWIMCFEEFIMALFPFPYVPDEVDRFYDRILAEGIHTPVNELSKKFPVCKRTIQRQFKTRLGVCPKILARIVRLNYILAKLRSNEPPDYQNFVFEGNYFDQTHFIKDFKNMIDETPNCFFRRDLVNVKILSGFNIGN